MTDGIQFNDDYGESYSVYGDVPRGITGKVISLSHGLIKTKKQANYVLVIIAVIAIVFSFSLKKPKKEYIAGAFPVPPPADIDFDSLLD